MSDTPWELGDVLDDEVDNAQVGEIDEARVEDETDIRLMREQAERFDRAQADRSALQRENALLKSGLDFESPLGKYFIENYDGEFTVESLRTRAVELGIPRLGQSAPRPE